MSEPDAPDDSPPFQRHRTYYVVLKYVILAAAVALAVYVFGLTRGAP
ncbi:MAG: hypothetical protein J0H62_03725 [Rhizobiales bacterium]|nr:hypothetical protein [Hyphomicrobiales bacterium]